MLTETPGLRDFLGHGTFSAKTGTIPSKMRHVSNSRDREDPRNYLDQPSQFTDLETEHLGD